MVGYKKNNTEFETVVENNYCTHNPLKEVPIGFLGFFNLVPRENG
jgi:hypothetical protein